MCCSSDLIGQIREWTDPVIEDHGEKYVGLKYVGVGGHTFNGLLFFFRPLIISAGFGMSALSWSSTGFLELAIVCSLTHLIIHPLTHPHAHSSTHPPTRSLTHSPTHPLTRSLTHTSSYPPTHSHTHPFTHSHFHTLTRPLIYFPAYSQWPYS